jgi:translation initiation factor IF-2
MAKIRIYELARELNMTNKDLLIKLKEMDVEAGSHMSSLEDEAVAKVKAFVLGKKEPHMVETRIRPTVIRRRKRVVPTEVEVPEELQLAEPQEEEASTAEEVAPAEVVAAEESAAETSPAEPESVTIDEPETVESEPEAIAEAEQASQEEAPQPTIEPKAIEEQEPIPVDLPPVEADSAQPEALETSATTADEPTIKEKEIVETPKTITKPKKVKKETAAKIIRLPSKPPEKPVPSEPAARPKPAPKGKQVPYPVAPEPSAESKPEPASKDKKKGKKKGVAVDIENKQFFKKKIAFRRREVIEGKDLYGDKPRSHKARKSARTKAAPAAQKTQITTAKAIKRRVKMDETIILSELAKRMGIKANEMIAKLMGMGVMATVNQTIDFETAALLAAEFGYEAEKASFEEEAILKLDREEDPKLLKPRPPVVTIMGHVDHGKTSLLDVIRKTRVTELEAGGITQHIGAYNVPTDKGNIVFLDTPGHEAFSAMRSRGAEITDIVVLVVAADDGVMPQTVEAVNHSKAAKVPIIVAVNKMDKAEADPERVQRELSDIGLVPEAWGGDIIFVKVSAKQNTGIDDLLEMILLQSEILELKANPDKLAMGRVVEAKLDSGRGPVATVLVQEGTLRTGDPVVCGVHYGKVRALLNDRGAQVKSAGPSIPVEILGLTGVPMAGDEMVALNDEKDAKQVSSHRIQKQRSKELAKTSRLSLDSLFEKMQMGEVKDLNVIIKADVDGSIEALRDSLVKLSNEEVTIQVIHTATGTITESDIFLAAGSDAIIIGFNVRANTKVQEMAQEENVDIRYYNVIYNVIKDVKDAIVGMMESTFEERTLGRAEVRQVFHVPKVGTIAGCYVTDGKIERGQMVRLLRDGIVTYEGKIASLRRYKDDVKEVQSGYECGIAIENFNDIKVGDVTECYYLEEIKPQID